MIESDEYEIFNKFGGFVDEIRFSRIPNTSILEALSEGFFAKTAGGSKLDEEVRFYFPLDTAVDIDEYECSGVNGSIYSANFNTDCFMEWCEIQSFPNLRSLVLTFNILESDYVDDRDIRNMQIALLNLDRLELIVFDVSSVQRQSQEQVLSQIEEVMRFSCDNRKIEFIRSDLKIRGMTRKKQMQQILNRYALN